MFKRSLYFLLFFLFCSNCVLGQKPILKFRHFGEEQGLSNSTVENILQDNWGFIWVGTSNGLNRFDGYHFEVYQHNAGDSNSLSNNYINALIEDRRHQLWVGTNSGLNLFDRENHRFVRYENSPGDLSSISANAVTAMAEDKSGNIWIGTTGGGINMLPAGRHGFIRFNRPDQRKLRIDTVNAIFCDHSGAIWIGSTGGLFSYNASVKKFVKVPGFNISIVAINESGDNLWIGSQFGGLFIKNLRSGLTKRLIHNDRDPSSIGSNLLKQIMVDRHGSVWVACTNGGLNLYRVDTDSFYHYEREPGNDSSLSQKSLYSIFEDRQGNLWLGAPRGGLNLFMPQANKFNLFRQNATGTGLAYDDVRSFYEDPTGIIWIGTDGGGVNLFSSASGFLKTFRHDIHKAGSLSSDDILNISGDRKDNAWISTYGGGLNVYQPVTGTFRTYRHEPANKESISSDYVTKTFEDSHHNFWVATNRGLNRLNPENGSFSVVKKIDASGKNQIYGDEIIDICEDHDENLWVLTLDAGLNRYNLKSNVVHHYFNDKSGTQSIAAGFTDNNGRFWLAANGLYYYNEDKNKFFKFPIGKSGDDLFIKAIEEDDEGFLWASTSHGILKIDPKTEKVTAFNAGDGLQSGEFEVKSSLKTKNGMLFFGGINGFNSFLPSQIGVNRYDSPVYITGLELFNVPVKPGESNSPLTKDITITSLIRLSHDQNSITFSFASLNFINSQNNQYKYKLDGIDKDWVYNGSQNRTVYTNISPGKYTFHVRAANNDGYWSTREAVLRVVVAPPFYQTWWFRALILISIAWCMYRYISFRHQMEIKKLEDRKNEELHELQVQFFTNISHEFRTPLSLILGPLEKIKEMDISKQFAGYFTTIDRNANRLMNLINELMDFNKVSSGAIKLQVQKTDLHCFLKEIVDEFRMLSTLRNIELGNAKIEGKTTFQLDPNVLEKIILNLLHNSYKYSEENAIVSVKAFVNAEEIKPLYQNKLLVESKQRFRKYFYIEVVDNGIGISKKSIQNLFERYFRVNSSHMGSGVGLAFVKSLTLLHKGDIHVYSELNKGTQIIIALPDDENAYNGDERSIVDHLQNNVNFEAIQMIVNGDDLIPGPLEPDFPSKQTERILIVEDNEELRKFYKSTLENRYRIIEAANGAEALAIAREGNIDLIITDIMMPVMDGIRFCKNIKDDIDTSHIPLIMLTAKTRQESQLEGVESGADLYLAKPVSLRLLRSSINNIFVHSHKLKEFFANDYYADAKDIVNTTRDKDFMEKLYQILDEQIISPELDVEFVCQEIGMSRTKLYQKIKSLTGQSIVEFIRSFRLKKAIKIMTHEDVSINEVIYRVGIQTHSHFTKSFKKEFGKTPSQFLMEIQRRTS